MKTTIHWGMAGFFSLMLAMTACGSEDPEPNSNNAGGSGGEAGSIDPDGGDELDAGDDADSGEENPTDGGEEADVAEPSEGGDGNDACELCLEDPDKCGPALDACTANAACRSAFEIVPDCMKTAASATEQQACLDQLLADGGQPAQDLLDCAQVSCTECLP